MDGHFEPTERFDDGLARPILRGAIETAIGQDHDRCRPFLGTTGERHEGCSEVRMTSGGNVIRLGRRGIPRDGGPLAESEHPDARLAGGLADLGHGAREGLAPRAEVAWKVHAPRSIGEEHDPRTDEASARKDARRPEHGEGEKRRRQKARRGDEQPGLAPSRELHQEEHEARERKRERRV